MDEREAKDTIKKANKFRNVLADAFSFIRSVEVNRALSVVKLEDMMNEQISRNGESSKSASKKYDPYTFRTSEDLASDNVQPVAIEGEPGNFITGTEGLNPTKMDRLTALKNAINTAIDSIKAVDPKDLTDAENSAENLSNTTEETRDLLEEARMSEE